MIFFSSDHHFGHANIIKYCKRPFENVEAMNEEMVRLWNEVVGANDAVYYIGDFALGIQAVEQFAPRLHGEKHLIMGNHDPCHPLHKKRADIGRQAYKKVGFKSFELEKVLQIANEDVLLNHMPYLQVDSSNKNSEEKTPGYTPRHLKYRPNNRGKWLLHGHVHEKWKTRDRMINVGVDVWNFRPIPITEIENLIYSIRKD